MLFNLASDIGEQHDLADVQPGKLTDLKKLYEAWSTEVDADCRKLGIEPKTGPVTDATAGKARPKR